MAERKLSELMQMQRMLWQQHRDSWDPMEPEYARNSMLYLVEELGECIALLKKQGEREIADNPAVRSAFVTEMSDVLMYYLDTLLRFGITAQELTDAYTAKHEYDKKRDYQTEYDAWKTRLEVSFKD